MKNISIHVKSIDSIDSNILSAKIYTNDNQLIFKKKNIEFGIFQYAFPSQGIYKLQVIIAKDRYIYTIWKNIYITEKEFDKIYLYSNISNSIKTYKIMKLTDQNYEGLPIERKNKIMAKQHIIPITNGVGSKEIDNGTYTITANTI